MKLTDFPQFVKIKATVEALKNQELEVVARIQQIELEMTKPKQKINGEDAWQRALEGNGEFSVVEIDTSSELRAELSFLEGRLRFVHEALEVGQTELDKVRGICSLEICATIRPQWVAEIGKILQHLLISP
jgi:hypothetical protein